MRGFVRIISAAERRPGLCRFWDPACSKVVASWSVNKIACSNCGVLILVATAMRNGGKCVPCSNGTRDSMEANRQWNREHRARLQTDPSRLYWSSLVKRAHASGSGFDALSETEKKYFAVCSLNGEVHNGGFQQFFYNSSGALYGNAIAGLEEMGASESLLLLQRAKQVFFDFADVPLDTGSRRRLLDGNSSHSRESRSEELDELFRKDPDDLVGRIERYARSHDLY
jgi:hypothetical protein